MTEFLPVSSSGHQVIAQRLFGVELDRQGSLAFTILVHLGSVAAIVLHLATEWRHWAALLLRRREASRTRGDSPDEGAEPSVRRAADAQRGVDWQAAWRWVWFVGLATLPAAIVGLFFKSAVESIQHDLWLAGAGLLLTALLLVVGERLAGRPAHAAQPAGTIHQRRPASGAGASILLIGIAQAVAIIPGVSRSGSTIAAGMSVGLDRTEATRFSFLLALVAICGATLLDARQLDALADHLGAEVLAVGFIGSLVASLVALKLLLVVVRRGRLSWFALYCVLVGVAAITVDALGAA